MKIEYSLSCLSASDGQINESLWLQVATVSKSLFEKSTHKQGQEREDHLKVGSMCLTLCIHQ